MAISNSNDMDTTNINDLPILNNSAPTSSEENINNMNINKNNVIIDNNVLQPQELNKKQVSFNDNLEYSDDKRENKNVKHSFNFKLEYKIIILATFFFFIFNDEKFKKYILNILVQIFGSFLKSETNKMTLIGLFIYSLFYLFVLLLIVSLIDFTSLHLSL